MSYAYMKLVAKSAALRSYRLRSIMAMQKKTKLRVAEVKSIVQAVRKDVGSDLRDMIWIQSVQ